MKYQEAVGKLEKLENKLFEAEHKDPVYNPNSWVYVSNPHSGSRLIRSAFVLVDEEYYYILAEHDPSEVISKDSDWVVYQFRQEYNTTLFSDYSESLEDE